MTRDKLEYQGGYMRERMEEIKNEIKDEYFENLNFDDPMDHYAGYDSTTDRVENWIEKKAEEYGVSYDLMAEACHELEYEENADIMREWEWANTPGNLTSEEYNNWEMGNLDISDRITSGCHGKDKDKKKKKAVKSSVEFRETVENATDGIKEVVDVNYLWRGYKTVEDKCYVETYTTDEAKADKIADKIEKNLLNKGIRTNHYLKQFYEISEDSYDDLDKRIRDTYTIIFELLEDDEIESARVTDFYQKTFNELNVGNALNVLKEVFENMEGFSVDKGSHDDHSVFVWKERFPRERFSVSNPVLRADVLDNEIRIVPLPAAKDFIPSDTKWQSRTLGEFKEDVEDARSMFYGYNKVNNSRQIQSSTINPPKVSRDDIEKELDRVLTKKRLHLDNSLRDETIDYILSFFDEEYPPKDVKEAVSEWYRDTKKNFPDVFGYGNKIASSRYLTYIRSIYVNPRDEYLKMQGRNMRENQMTLSQGDFDDAMDNSGEWIRGYYKWTEDSHNWGRQIDTGITQVVSYSTDSNIVFISIVEDSTKNKLARDKNYGLNYDEVMDICQKQMDNWYTYMAD